MISNPAISAILGGIAGTLATFVPSYWLTRRKDKRFQESISRLIKIELESYREFLHEILGNGTVNEERGARVIGRHNAFIFRINQMMPNGNFTLQNYSSISAESKGIAFDEETLGTLEDIYRDLRSFRWAVEIDDERLFFIRTVQQLIDDIDEIVPSL